MTSVNVGRKVCVRVKPHTARYKMILNDQRVTVREVPTANGVKESTLDIVSEDHLNFHNLVLKQKVCETRKPKQ